MIVDNVKKVYSRDVNELYSASSLADALGLSKEMIYYFKKKGVLKAYEVNRSRYVFMKTDVLNLLENKGYEIIG
jgi:hypothetical protein